MSFYAPANPPPEELEPPITSDPWFPAIDIQAARAACRLDGTVDAQRLRYALIAAIGSVNAELEQYQLEMRSRWGYEHLADIPAQQIAGESRKCHDYRRAVYECLQADLEEAYRNQSTIPDGKGKEARVREALDINISQHRRNMRWAISDILGIRRTTVELI